MAKVKTMTVKELIQQLKLHPKDAIVQIGHNKPITNISVSKQTESCGNLPQKVVIVLDSPDWYKIKE